MYFIVFLLIQFVYDTDENSNRFIYVFSRIFCALIFNLKLILYKIQMLYTM